ncbi:methyltransferase [Emcibacter sp.]|uniref:methyltransferase n=1 Tax=Emcibacter sp. TaxID=1979954 RepID=UPI002AA8807E|nr:methyltransferase [Emcibacter sp.]
MRPCPWGNLFIFPTVQGGGHERLSGIGGNFFEEVPADGDLYLLKLILHDWNDDQCIEILKNIRTAIRPDGTLCIIEILVPDDFTPHGGWMADLNMMALTGGRERSRKEYEGLLEKGGFRLTKTMELPPTSMNILEAVPIS